MGLEAVKEEVIRQAKEQETALIAEARKEANRIMREAEKKAEELREKNDAETKKIIDTIKRQELASAEPENKEKTVRVDYSFETLLDGIKENELQNISKILFG